MDTYLLDTNVISVVLNKNHVHHEAVMAYLNGLPQDARRYVSTVTLGEMEFGLELARRNGISGLDRIESILSHARQMPRLPIEKHSAAEYGYIKAAMARRYQPTRSIKGKKDLPRWVEDWVDEFTGKTLQVDENDIWIAAQAVARRLVLIALDNDMLRIRDAIPDRLRVNVIPMTLGRA